MHFLELQVHFSIWVSSVRAICSAYEQFFYHCGVDFDQIWPSFFKSFLGLSPFFFVHVLDAIQRCQYHGNEQWYGKQKIYSHLNARGGFPAKYKAITLSRLNFIRNHFSSECNRSKCFCKLVNNQMNYWNKSVSCQMSGLQMIKTSVAMLFYQAS